MNARSMQSDMALEHARLVHHKRTPQIFCFSILGSTAMTQGATVSSKAKESTQEKMIRKLKAEKKAIEVQHDSVSGQCKAPKLRQRREC